MRKTSTLLMAILLNLPFICSGQVIDAAQFGLTQGKDATPAIRKALEACKAQNAKKLIIPKGTYHFHPDMATERYVNISNNDGGLKRIAFPLYGFNGLEIDGQGSLFIMHGEILPFNLEGSENIVLKNFSLDWNKPFNFQGQVIGVNPETNSFDLKVYEECDYEIVANELIFLEKPGKAVRTWRQWPMPIKPDIGWEQNLDWNIWFDPVTKAGAYNGGGNHILRSYNEKLKVRYHVEELEKGILRFFNAAAELPRVGWALVIKGKKSLNRYSPAIHLLNVDDISFENINIHHAGGMGLIGERSSNIKMENFNVKLREGSGRLVSTTADATHFVSCRGVISFNNCFFENMLDDATNIHGIYTEVVSPIDDYTLGIRRMHGQQMGFQFAGPGDSVSLSENVSLYPYAGLKVKSVYEPNNEYMELTFTEKVADILRPNSVANNISWQPDLIFKNSTVRRNRARCILISTAGKALVENNHFENSTGAGIHIAGDGTFWYESGPVRNVIIRDNLFKELGVQGNSPVIQINPRLKFNNEPTHYFHKNILIENNTFEIFRKPVVRAFSTENLRFRNNIIKKSKAYPMDSSNSSPFSFEYCKDILIEGNDYKLDEKAFIETDKWIKGLIIRKNRGIEK